MTIYAVIPRTDPSDPSTAALRQALVPLPAHADALAQAGPADIVVVPVHLLNPQECAVLLAWASQDRGPELILLWDGTRTVDVLALLSVTRDPHVVALSGGHFSANLGFVLRKLLYPEEPLRTCVGPDGAVREWTLQHSAQRHDIIHDAQQAMLAVGHNARSAGVVATLLEELSSNALYDAPVDGAGVPRNRHLPRQQPVTLAPGEEVQLFLAFAERRVFVSARDPFGSFQRAHLVEQTEIFMRRGQRTPRAGPGGAGIGLLFAMDLGHHFLVEVRQGGWTEVASVVDFSTGQREQRSPVKTVNLFTR